MGVDRCETNQRDVQATCSTPLPRCRIAPRRRQIIIADKGYSGRTFETGLNQTGIDLLRSARGEAQHPARSAPGQVSGSSNHYAKSSNRPTRP